MPAFAHRYPLAALLALPALTAACVMDPGPPDEDPPPVVTSGTYHHFVQTGWDLPLTSAEAQTIGFDLDDDGRRDNQAGGVISALSGIGLDLVGASATAFTGGELVILHSVRADGLIDDGAVSWRVLGGAPTEAPRFDGTDVLRPAREDGMLVGAIIDGRAELKWGVAMLTVPFFPDQRPLPLPLAHARIRAELQPDGCSGSIGGVMLEADIETTLTRLAQEAIVHIERHPENSFAQLAVDVFDANNDGRVSVEELAGSSLAQSLFDPDVDTDGDGDDDGLSFGLGFDCVPAQFTAPGEL